MRQTLAAIALAVLTPSLSLAATVGAYRIDAAGGLSRFKLDSYDVQSLETGETVVDYDSDEIFADILAQVPAFAEAVGSTTGSVSVAYAPGPMESVFSDCTGLLRILCGSGTFDPSSGTAMTGDNVGFFALLQASSLAYEDDANYRGETERYRYDSLARGIRLEFALTEVTIAPVPLPAGGALLATGMVGLGLARVRRRRR